MAQLLLQVQAGSSSQAGVAGVAAAVGDISAPGPKTDAEVVVATGEAAVAVADMRHLRRMKSTGKPSGPELSIPVLLALAETAVRETRLVSSTAVLWRKVGASNSHPLSRSRALVVVVVRENVARLAAGAVIAATESLSAVDRCSSVRREN